MTVRRDDWAPEVRILVESIGQIRTLIIGGIVTGYEDTSIRLDGTRGKTGQGG